MGNSTTGALEDLNKVRIRHRNGAIKQWMAANDEYLLADVTYAISMTELNANDDRELVMLEVTIAAIAAAIWLLSFSIDVASWIRWALLVNMLLLMFLAASARKSQTAQLLTLEQLYDLRDRAPRRLVRERIWSRRGQVYLAPKGGRNDEQPSRP